MFILLAAIFAVILIVGVIFTCIAKYYRDSWSRKENDKMYSFGRFINSIDLDAVLVAIGAIGLAISLIVILCLGIAVSNTMVIDDKIAMYEEENATINSEVNIIVSNYKEHELEVFDNAKENISPMVVFTLYPELKSNTLVEKQISTYIENQQEIKALKSKKLDYEVFKWWLHF